MFDERAESREVQYNEFKKKVLKLLRNYFEKEMEVNLDSESLDLQSKKEILDYWVLIAAGNLIYLEEQNSGYHPEKVNELYDLMTNGSEEDILKHFLEHFDKRDSGVDRYSGYLGADINNLVVSSLKQQNLVKVLDIGCAEGYFLDDLKRKFQNNVDCYGLSPLYEGVEKKSGLNLDLGVAEAMPKNYHGQFDLVVTVNASMYFWDIQRAFDQAVLSLRKDGILLFGCGTIKPMAYFMHNLIAQVTEKKPDDFFKKMENNHRMFYKRIKELLKKGAYTLNDKDFSIEELETNNLAWTPVTYKVQKKSD
jgi:SAM-dependent methyltransferase